MLRASEFPPNRKNQTAQAFRKFRDAGGRQIPVPILEWERMIMVREFHTHHRNDPGFSAWFAGTKLLSKLAPMIPLLRLDLMGYGLPKAAANGANGHARDAKTGANGAHKAAADRAMSDAHASDAAETGAEPANPDEEELPLSVILDENGGYSSIVAGRELANASKPVRLNKNVLKRHAAVLGGSGSGKTTLALCLIEQLLLRGIPAVLIDRKGDLCSYANPDVWRDNDEELSERRGEREKLADAIDVAVFTPGRASGRPISITLLPNGINELPDHEQQLLANLSAAALGEMLHLKNSATHQKQSGTLSVALRILGSRHSREVTLSDLIHLLEDEDPELSDLTQRMDPSGKIRRDLVAQLDSLRHRNSALFEAGGESLRMESLLGLGPYAREGRTRLSIIYTGFLGDNENILFWVSQFLSEALRFCQRNPNDELQAVVMFDEADLYIPANAKPATAEPLQSLLKRARSAGLGMMLATQSPGDLDYKSRDQITSWFIGRVREDTALRKLKAAFQSESGLEPAAVLPGQTVGEFHLVQEGLVRPMKAQRSLITAEQVPFDRIEQLARETKGQDERQLKLFDIR
jgi:DNA helicase HerA-like ATPase